MLTRIDIHSAEGFVPPPIQFSDERGYYVEIGEVVAQVPPHQLGKQFSPADVFTVFLEDSKGLVLNMLASYFYDLLRNQQASRITVNSKPLPPDRQAILNALEEISNANR